MRTKHQLSIIPPARPRPYKRLRALADGIEAARWYEILHRRRGQVAAALAYSMVAADMSETAEAIVAEHVERDPITYRGIPATPASVPGPSALQGAPGVSFDR